MLRLFFPSVDAASPLVVVGERFHYLARVHRVREGDTLEVFDGQGRAFPARVTALTEASAALELGPPTQVDRGRPLYLIQGLPKSDKLEQVIQRCTELGAAGFYPALTERAVARPSAEKGLERARRWRKIAEEAARQSGRSDVPEVRAPAPLSEAVAALPSGAALLVLDEEETARSLSQAFQPLERGRPVGVVIGPEGGLSRAEVTALQESGGVTVSLGRRILRTETAPTAAVAILRHLDGELG